MPVLFDGFLSTLEDMIILWKVVCQIRRQKLSLVAMEYASMLHSLPARVLMACWQGGTCDSTTIDFIQQASGHVKIHPAVGGVQGVCMQLKWREHTLPAFFMQSHDILYSATLKDSLSFYPWTNT